MFFDKQSATEKEKYVQLLKVLGSLSNLFSDSKVPYLYYRSAENVFCKSFSAFNLSRSDTSADAKKSSLGIGLKTFLNAKNGTSYQKISEFNKQRSLYERYLSDPARLINFICEARNKRLDFTKKAHALDALIYHSVVRDAGKFYITEELMDFVVLDKLSAPEVIGNSIYFTDNLNDYLFNISKSTLYKRFTLNSLFDFNVDIFKDPLDLLQSLYAENLALLKDSVSASVDVVYLPLYSERGIRHVPEKSGLNQWNAGGRLRNEREVYIPIPSWIHSEFPSFFPNRDVPFNLRLPNETVISAKVCQEGSKALMSNPNSKLGEWLLDDVLRVPAGELVTIEMLDELGVDSVELRKIDAENFEINFKETGTFDTFKLKYFDKITP